MTEPTKAATKKNSKGETSKPAAAKKTAAKTTVVKKAAVKKPATAVAAKKKTATPAEKSEATPAAKNTAAIKNKPIKDKKAAPAKVWVKPTPEERYRMIETAAYFIAERSNFQGDPAAFWSAAEIEIATLLGE